MILRMKKILSDTHQQGQVRRESAARVGLGVEGTRKTDDDDWAAMQLRRVALTMRGC
jgi:hypothetical protein